MGKKMKNKETTQFVICNLLYLKRSKIKNCEKKPLKDLEVKKINVRKFEKRNSKNK